MRCSEAYIIALGSHRRGWSEWLFVGRGISKCDLQGLWCLGLPPTVLLVFLKTDEEIVRTHGVAAAHRLAMPEVRVRFPLSAL